MRVDTYRIGALALLAAACGRTEPGAIPEPDGVARVEVSSPASAPQILGFPATVEAGRAAQVSTRISGRITEIPVDVGSRVRSGQVVVSLDAGDVEAAIERAEAAERQARRTYERLEALERDGAATAQELDDARAAVEMAEAALKEARTQQRYAVLTAPFSGWVTARLADPGNMALPGQPILELIAEGRVKVVADVPAELGSRLAPGDPVTVREPVSDRRFEAHIARLAPAVQTEARLLRVEADLEGSPAAGSLPLPGAYVRLEVRGAGGGTLWLPEDALVRQGQLTGVWLVDGEELRLRWIRIGQRRPGAVEVLAGLTGDELVVREPSPDLMDGQLVEAASPVPWNPARTPAEAEGAARAAPDA
ncbi:MAG: efflux RND transporter periplasmic adaptor subunit [Gemmatimonadota bacterium]|jgi:RND family efflux transporter MFP subunit|nr:MAG: efflux RND transporter periplasmic adaptor subunit [Gemmatimonadota bacterium]